MSFRAMVRRATCFGRHKWIKLDTGLRVCHRCDLVEELVYCTLRGGKQGQIRAWSWRTADGSKGGAGE